MTARILVVDDIASNARLLEAKLTAEYYEVMTASDGPTALAIAASERPDIVLLDEVMAGLNQSEVGQAIALLQGLHADGLTFLIIEHNLKVVRAFSDRVVVLDRGRLIAEGTADQILNSPEVVKAYLGDGHQVGELQS